MEKNIGSFIQEIRKSKEITQKQLAEQIGVSDKTVSKWENRNSLPDTSMLLPLCNALGITVNELLACERISPENYSVSAEKNIISLIEENTRNKKGIVLSRIIGIAVLLFGLLLLITINAGLSFSIFYYIDFPSILIVSVLAVGVVLISGERTKRGILHLLSKTIIPIGLMSAIVSAIIMFRSVESVEFVAPNLAVDILMILYAIVAKIVIELLRVEK